MLNDGTEAFQRITAVRDLEIHLILSWPFSSEETEARAVPRSASSTHRVAEHPRPGCPSCLSWEAVVENWCVGLRQGPGKSGGMCAGLSGQDREPGGERRGSGEPSASARDCIWTQFASPGLLGNPTGKQPASLSSGQPHTAWTVGSSPGSPPHCPCELGCLYLPVLQFPVQ